MKQITCLIFLIFLTPLLFAQEEEELIALCRKFDYSELENGLNCFHPDSSQRVTYHWNSKLERELVNGYFEQIIEFRKDGKDEWITGIPTITKHEIRLIKKKDGKIAYYKIIRFEELEDGESVECRRTLSEIPATEESNSELEVLKARFQKTYHAPLEFKALFETEIVYGNHCGFGGSEPEYREKMNKLVLSKNKDELINWLKSPVAEIQLYAIDGILTLRESGVKFNRSVLKMIDAASKKEGFAHTCSGCLYRDETISELIDALKKRNRAKNEVELPQ